MFMSRVGASEAKPIDWSGRYVTTAPMSSVVAPTSSRSPTLAPMRGNSELSAQASPGAGMPFAGTSVPNSRSEIRTLPRSG